MSLLRRLASITFACIMVAAVSAVHAQGLAPIPPLTARVTDSAGILEPAQRDRLEAVLTDYESKTGSQIGVLLINTTAPEVIEQYSIRVADAWKVGRKGVDDGVLLIVAKDNPPALKRLRIEAGRGVQGVLTDAQSKRILQDVIAPHFRQNDYYGGLVAGIGAIAGLLNQEQFPAAQQRKAGAGAANNGSSWWPFLLFGALALATLFRSRGRHGLSRSGWGSGASGVILGAALGNALGHRGGFGGGGFGGGGGGGFSGGGGGFDGGGASGNW